MSTRKEVLDIEEAGQRNDVGRDGEGLGSPVAGAEAGERLDI